MEKDLFKNIMNVVYGFEENEEEVVICSNCKEQVPEDYGKLTEHDGFICEQCLVDGYGE